MISRIILPNELPAALATPAADADRMPLRVPGVLVLHAWWGLDANIERVCERLASFGYVALAPDLYRGRVASTAADAEMLRDALDRGRALEELDAALSFLQLDTGVRVGRTGVLGFSLGGSMALRLAAARGRDLGALVTFYGLAAVTDSLSMPVQAHFASHDEFVTEDEIESLRRVVPALEIHRYPDTGHGFFEHPNPEARHPDAARRGWDRTLAFFDRWLP